MGRPERELFPREKELVAKLRQICAALPEVKVERDGFGHTVFRVGKKTFVSVSEGDRGQGALWFKADHATQDILVRRGPYVRSPYIGQHGWVTIWGDAKIDWDEVAELVRDSYRLAAPKRILRQLDA